MTAAIARHLVQNGFDVVHALIGALARCLPHMRWALQALDGAVADGRPLKLHARSQYQIPLSHQCVAGALKRRLS